MCGIAGVINFKENRLNQALVEEMTGALVHRGPDDLGIWHDNNVGLGHCRLSIHDLSQAGHQPMFSYTGQWVIVFNGEIYNYKALKADLVKEYGILFNSDSDTEVLINAIECWGVEATLQKCIGMFAFAAFDRQARLIYLARDRFGEKPLYYGMQNNILGFSSELKALQPLKAVGWQFDVNRDVLSAYMRWGYISAPRSIFTNIYKLESGCYLKISPEEKLDKRCYWDMAEKALSKHNTFAGSSSEAVDASQEMLKASLSLQKASDVPIGAFLSGGVDSSLTVAIMQHISREPVKTFSIGFHEEKYNEAPFAKEVASYLRTDHTEVYLSQSQAMDIVPSLATIYDEPFADASQVPTYLVSQVAKKEVTVAISGDGGDELFGGYQRYFQSPAIWGKFAKLPKSVRMALAYTLGLCPAGFNVRDINVGDKFKKLKEVLLESNDFYSLYRYILSSEKKPDELVISSMEAQTEHSQIFPSLGFYEHMMLLDAKTYLQGDILTKVDRAAMAVSLETRVPFLDHRVFEFAWSLPSSYKIDGGQGKKVLKELLYRYIPKAMIDRPKKGFGIPYGEWLRGGLRNWAEELLDAQTLSSQGYLNVSRVRQYWQEHLSGKRNWQAVLWNILMFQCWLRRWQK